MLHQPAVLLFFFNDTATTEIYTLSLHDALPISAPPAPPRATPEPVVRLVPEEKTAPMAKPDLLVEHVSERPSAPDIAAAGTPQDIETFDGTIDIDAAAHSAARADGIEVQEEVVLEPREIGRAH